MSAGRLGFAKATTAAVYNVYKVPEGYYTKASINVAGDITGTVKVKVFISPADNPTSTHVIQVEDLSSVKTGFERTALVLNEGEWVSFEASSAGVVVSVFGVEYPKNGNEFSSTLLVEGNSESVLYTTPADSVATVNATISGIGGDIKDVSTVRLYVSTTNASNGSLLMKTSVGSVNTGIERTGLILKGGEKLIMVNSGLVGKLSCRIHGFKRVE